MSLSSVMHTSLTGLSAAETLLDVVSNNLANAGTAGFKASQAILTTQTPQTLSFGFGASGGRGGGNPMQIGGGVQVAGVAVDFSQGTVAIGGNPLSLALQGDGFFMLEGQQGQRLFSRDGRFRLNADSQLVSASGDRVLGFGVDKDFQIDASHLAPLEIRLGRQAAGANGSAATLTRFSIGEDGRIRGHFTDGVSRDLGQITLARFGNPGGLQARAQNVYVEGLNSGSAVESNPGDGGAATIAAGAVELSNTDIGQSLVDLVSASTLFRASLEVLDTAGSLWESLIDLRRMQ